MIQPSKASPLLSQAASVEAQEGGRYLTSLSLIEVGQAPHRESKEVTKDEKARTKTSSGGGAMMSSKRVHVITSAGMYQRNQSTRTTNVTGKWGIISSM